MAAGQRGGAARAEPLNEDPHVLGPLALVPVVVHADDRRAIARAEAFDLEQRELARGVGFARLEAQRLGQLLGDPLGAPQRAGQRPADLQHVLPGRAA